MILVGGGTTGVVEITGVLQLGALDGLEPRDEHGGIETPFEAVGAVLAEFGLLLKSGGVSLGVGRVDARLADVRHDVLHALGEGDILRQVGGGGGSRGGGAAGGRRKRQVGPMVGRSKPK